jgi:HK97 family phage major capsid protein
MTHNAQAANTDVRRAMNELLSSFETFKRQNDQRLEEIERKGSADTVLEEQVDRINSALDRQRQVLDTLSLAAQRPDLAVKGQSAVPSERKQAFDRYVRAGDTAALARLETKAIAKDPDFGGGYTAPVELDRMMAERLAELSPLRQVATVREVGGATYRKAVASAGPLSGWAGESEARPETTAPTLSVQEYPTMELYAMPAATQTLLDDAEADVDSWLIGEVEAEFAAQESAAFINGSGTDRPKGILQETKVAESTYTWGNIGFVASGASGGFAGTDPSDALVDLVYAPRQGFRANASFLMNRKTAAQIRKFKDADGNYLWSPGQAGQAPTLLGYPVLEAEDMPDVAANAFPVAFGDFGRGYLIVDRVGLRVLRDPYSAKPFVLFYVTKRVGGGVQNYDAIKLLRIAS